MDNSWDRQVPNKETWLNIYASLKPGAPLLAFGGTRTYHHLAMTLEEAGFEIRDCLLWLYGQGMPKSQDTSKAIDSHFGAEREVIGERTLTGNAAIPCKEKGGTYAPNAAAKTSGKGKSVIVPITAPATELAKLWSGYGSALKPSYELIVLARKPLSGSMASNVINHGCGPLNIDDCRVYRDPNDTSGWSESGSKASDNVAMSGANYERAAKPDAAGRHPANVILDPEAKDLLDASTKPTKSTPYKENVAAGSVLPLTKRSAGGYSDAGGVSRFFYCSKVSTSERGDSTHPTMKPIKLTEYLSLLILPPTDTALDVNGPRLLVPFSGSGSEMLGAKNAGWKNIVGIELNAEYITTARKRLNI